VAAAAVGLSRALQQGHAAGAGGQGGGGSTAPATPASPVRASPSGGPRASDWAALGRELPPGALLRPGDRGYPAARLLFDPRFDGIRPAGIASCATAANVASCISFARRFGLPIAARSGGHGYAGWSSTTGLMVDVGPMQSFRVDGSRVTVGAGLRLIDFYTHLAARGLAVPGGSCPTVGIAGLTLGGGVGVLGRQYGLTCDNLVGLEMVTADGRIRQVDAGHDPDLLWASQGGGGGNFGIATSFTFTARPLASLTQFFLSWPWSQAARVVGGWQRWAPHLSDQWWANLHLAAAPGAAVPLSVQVGGTFLGSPQDAGGELSRLFAAVGSDPSSGEPFESPYLHAMLIEAGCSTLTTDQCHLPGSRPGQSPGGLLARQPELAKSDFFTRPLPASGLASLIHGAEQFLGVRPASGGSGGIALDACGGAINRVSPGRTAFVHRDALFLAQYTTTWTAGAAGGGAGRQRDWQRTWYQRMRPYASGQAYQNYIDPSLANWRQAYYGANYPRLARIKAAYDADRLFRFPQAITPG
jgi:hypothetical protein